jgi:hypothetical protein
MVLDPAAAHRYMRWGYTVAIVKRKRLCTIAADLCMDSYILPEYSVSFGDRLKLA